MANLTQARTHLPRLLLTTLHTAGLGLDTREHPQGRPMPDREEITSVTAPGASRAQAGHDHDHDPAHADTSRFEAADDHAVADRIEHATIAGDDLQLAGELDGFVSAASFSAAIRPVPAPRRG